MGIVATTARSTARIRRSARRRACLSGARSAWWARWNWTSPSALTRFAGT